MARWEALGLGRIRTRLLVVNLLVLIVPVAGLELAELHERQLLDALERDMRHQAILVRRALEADLVRGVPLGDPRHEEALEAAARDTRTRVRVFDAARALVLDSHRVGPPEGPEPPPPSYMGRPRASSAERVASDDDGERWPAPADRREVRAAFGGARSAYTRVRAREPAVLLFLAEPLFHVGRVTGVVYVVRSTAPVLEQLYVLRGGLFTVLGVSLVFTLLVTLALALSISRPVGKLARAARRIAAGEKDVRVPVSGGGEIRELGASFAAMTEELAARMRYISEFAADVAHELKSPLTAIRGAAELLTEEAADDPEARARFLSNILLDVERLDLLVSRLLELSRIEASEAPWQEVDLDALLERVMARTRGPDDRVELAFATEVRRVPGRPADLETAVANLVENALHFTAPGTPVTVTVRADERPGAIAIDVADRGPGVPAAHEAAVFDRFFTTRADEGGTGLGLAIVKAVAQAHGGTVRVRSAPGEGAVFTLVLPAR